MARIINTGSKNDIDSKEGREEWEDGRNEG